MANIIPVVLRQSKKVYVQGWFAEPDAYCLSDVELIWALKRAGIQYELQGGNQLIFKGDNWTIVPEEHEWEGERLILYPVAEALTLLATRWQYLIELSRDEWRYDYTLDYFTSLVSTPLWLQGRVTREHRIVTMYLCTTSANDLVDVFLVDVFTDEDTYRFCFVGGLSHETDGSDTRKQTCSGLD